MIRTHLRNDRNELEPIDENNPEYWNGAWRYEPYPKALYRATAGEGYTNPQSRIVRNEDEHAKLGSDWAESPHDARLIADKRDSEMASIAAQRNYTDSKMSDKAQAEALAADRADADMLPAIPEQPRLRKKPGRKPKAASVTEPN